MAAEDHLRVESGIGPDEAITHNTDVLVVDLNFGAVQGAPHLQDDGQADPGRRAQLRDAARVPDDYATWQRVVGLYWIVNTIDIPEPLTRLFSYILFTVIILSITRVVSRTVNGVVAMHIERSDRPLPKTTLLSTILTVIIYAMGVLVVLQYYGISIAPILTAMGVGGMAVALALQETLANIFSGLHLIISKQLRLDDYIKLNTGEEGRVTDITWRFTTIVPAGGGNMIVIPNQKIASSNITNYSMPHKDIVISIPVGVAYDSDLDKVERVTLEVAREVMSRIDKDVKMEPAVRFHTFGESSIDFNVVLHSSYFEHQFLLKHEFIKALTRRYREEGIEIPYPTRTVLQPEEL